LKQYSTTVIFWQRGALARSQRCRQYWYCDRVCVHRKICHSVPGSKRCTACMHARTHTYKTIYNLHTHACVTYTMHTYTQTAGLRNTAMHASNMHACSPEYIQYPCMLTNLLYPAHICISYSLHTLRSSTITLPTDVLTINPTERAHGKYIYKIFTTNTVCMQPHIRQQLN